MNKSKKATFFLICFVMIVLAFIDGILGVFLPQIKAELAINDTQASAIFTINLLGFIIFTTVGGHLCDKIGYRKSFLFLLGFLFVSCLTMLLAQTYARLLIISFVMYCLLAALTVTTNSSIPFLFASSKALFMSFFHLVNYGGISLSKITAGLLVKNNLNWRYIYLIIAVIIIVCLAFLWFSFFPTTTSTTENVASTESRPPTVTPLKNIVNVFFFLYILAVGGYISSITAMHNWFVNYAHFSFNIDISKASSVFSLFFIFSAAGSIIFAKFIKRIGEKRIVFIFSFIASLLFIVGLMLGSKGLYIIAFCGLFFSVTYPTTLVNINSAFPIRPGFVLGLIVTSGSIINLAFTATLGKANDVLGPRISFYLVPLGFIIFCISSFIIYLLQRKKNHNQWTCPSNTI